MGSSLTVPFVCVCTCCLFLPLRWTIMWWCLIGWWTMWHWWYAMINIDWASKMGAILLMILFMSVCNIRWFIVCGPVLDDDTFSYLKVDRCLLAINIWYIHQCSEAQCSRFYNCSETTGRAGAIQSDSLLLPSVYILLSLNNVSNNDLVLNICYI